MSSVYALPTPTALYREDQRFGWWVYALVALLFLLGWALLATRRAPILGQDGDGRMEFSLGVTLGMAIPAGLIVGLLKMTTVVYPTEVRVWFGWIPTYRRAFPLAAINGAAPVQYRPIADCGGWGILNGRNGERVLSARGDRGVLLTLSDGSLVLIGSQRSEELARTIQATSSLN